MEKFIDSCSTGCFLHRRKGDGWKQTGRGQIPRYSDVLERPFVQRTFLRRQT